MNRSLVIKASESLICPSCGHDHGDPMCDFTTESAYLSRDIQEYECDNCDALIEFSVRHDNETFDVVVED